MRLNVPDELLTTQDVRPHAFGVCQIQDGRSHVSDPAAAALTNSVLAGRGVLQRHGDARSAARNELDQSVPGSPTWAA